MVLVVSINDFKVRSVSRQKIRVYEGAYAKFDPTKHPVSTEIVPRHEETHGVGDAVPDHVLSIKILSDAQRNAELNETNALEGPDSESQPNLIEESSSQGDSKQGGESPHTRTCEARQFRVPEQLGKLDRTNKQCTRW